MEEGEELVPYCHLQVQGIGVRPVLSLANYISLDIECVVAGSSDRSIRFLDTDNLQEIAKCTVDKKSVNFVAVSEMSPIGDDPVIATGGKDSVIQIWDPASGCVDKSLTMPTTEVRSLAIYQGVELLIVMVGAKDGQVYVWDVKTNTQLAHFKGHKASVHCVCIASTSVSMDDQDPDLSSLSYISGGADRTVRSWDFRTGKKLHKFRHIRSISSMVVTNRGVRPLLATAGVERVIKLWDLNTGILLRSLEGHLDQINTLALWEGLQMLLISGSADHTIRIFDMLSGECICVLLGHTDSVLSLTITNASDPKIVSSSEDLSIIQWDLNRILSDFYYSDEDGDLAGARNARPALLPKVNYSAPAELDRDRLSKDERKRIRKERKREKRKRNLSVGLRSSLQAMEGDEAMGLSPVERRDREMEGEEGSGKDIAWQQARRWIQEGMEGSDDDDEFGEDLRPAETVPTVVVQSTLLTQIMQKNKVVPFSDAVEEGRPAGAASSGSSSSKGREAQASMVKSSSGRIVADWFRKALGIHNSVAPWAGDETEREDEQEAEPEEKRADSPMTPLSPLSPDRPFGAIWTSDREETTPVARREEDVSEAAVESKDQGLASAVPPPTVEAAAVAAVEAAEAAVDTAEAALPVPATTVKPSTATTAAEPASQAAETTPTSSSSSPSPLPTQEVLPRTATTPPPSSLTTIAAVSTPVSTARAEAQLVRTRQGSLIKAEDFKAKARSAQSNFAIASIEHQLEVDRKKTKAADKLQQRLLLKNKLLGRGAAEKDAEGEREGDGESGREGSEAGLGREEGKSDQELHAIKAEKLKQHKLQENRRKQSLAVAQQRSAEALQKRLEELALRKKQQVVEEGEEEDGETSSSDEEG